MTELKRLKFLKFNLTLIMSTLSIQPCLAWDEPSPTPIPTAQPDANIRRTRREVRGTEPTALSLIGKYLAYNIIQSIESGYQTLKYDTPETMHPTARGYAKIQGSVFRGRNIEDDEAQNIDFNAVPYWVQLNTDGSYKIRVALGDMQNANPDEYRQSEYGNGWNHLRHLRVAEFTVEKFGNDLNLFNFTLLDLSMQIPLVKKKDPSNQKTELSLMTIYGGVQWHMGGKNTLTKPDGTKIKGGDYTSTAWNLEGGARVLLPITDLVRFGIDVGYGLYFPSSMDASGDYGSDEANTRLGLKLGGDLSIVNKNGSRFVVFYKSDLANMRTPGALNGTTSPILPHQAGIRFRLNR